MTNPIASTQSLNTESGSRSSSISDASNVSPIPSNSNANAPTSESSSTREEDNAKNNLSTPTDTDMNSKAKHRGRKKTLAGPPYICQFPDCGKVFQRSEHLSRHKLNHNPKKIFTCNYKNCGKTFVRHDLLVRHLKRHDNKIQKQKSSIKPSEFLSTVVSNSINDDDTIITKRRNNEITTNTTFPSNSDVRTSSTPSISNNNGDLFSVKDVVQQHSDSDVLTHSEVPNHMTNSSLQTPDLINFNSSKPRFKRNDTNINNPNIKHTIHNTPNLFNWLFPDVGLLSGADLSHPSDNNFSNQSPSNANAAAILDNYMNSSNILGHEDIKSLNDANTGTTNSELNNNLNNNQNYANSIAIDLSELGVNNGANNFFIVNDDFSPSTSSYVSSTPDQNHVNKATSNANKPANTNLNNPPTNFDFPNITRDNLQSFQHSQGQQASSSSLPYQFDENQLYTLTEKQMNEFEILVPSLKGHIDFTKLKFEKALKTYWNFFHPRFPMLHRPTFDSRNAPVLLLLSMVILGSKLFMCVDNITCPDDKKLLQPKSLADTISEPLRWLLFSSPFFQPPVEVWIIQSLLMLEFYEKHCSSRTIHERSHLHHGTTIQLLRRSPTLGGASTKLNNDETSNEGTSNWYKWIEVESMKRATFMCFYMDAIDAICFGHQMFIYSHQIQMTMPVEDSVWESNFQQFNKNFKNAERPRQFLMVLRDIMNGKATKANSFGKKILLAGLSAILFQIQQRDLQLFFGLDKFTNSISKNWRDLLTAAFAIWRNDVGNSCCSSKTAIDNLNSLGNSSQFSTSDTRCKCIGYHLAHIYMSISHYDIFIICGAPWRMNVKPSSDFERNAIKRRVYEWSKTRHCEISIVQSYLSLFEMFLSPQDSTYEYQYDYLPDADLFFRSYNIGYTLLVIWSYLYSKNKFKDIDVNNEYNQNGYLYLKNIRNQFTLKSEGILLHTWFENQSGAEFYADLMRWVNVLSDIEGIGNILGLLEMVGDKLAKADYIVVRELGKLLLFCRDRTIGNTDKEILEDMYHEQ